MDTHKKTTFNKNILVIPDIAFECNRIISKLRQDISSKLLRSGAVVGISGGIDSAVTFALSVHAMGPDSVLGIMLPEKESSDDSLRYAQHLADTLGAASMVENITEPLMGLGCYARRDEAVKRVYPEYDPGQHKMKIGVKKSGLYTSLPPLFYLTIVDDHGNEKSWRLPAAEFRQIEAASNFKQRCRMAMLYFHAERLHYAVTGTPNKHEVEQGFFVKHGDGGADVMPIAHLYKTQVYQLAKYLGIPQEIIDRTPTTDTYSAEQTQEEFFFQLPFDQLDLLWYAYENGYEPSEVGPVMKMTPDLVRSIYMDFDRKRKTTEYLRMPPVRDASP